MTTSPPTAENVFRFRYTLFVVDARIEGDRLEATTGIKTISVPLAKLQHLYVHHPRNAQIVELLLSYVHKGRLKRVRIYSDPGQAAFDGLVKALLIRRPDIDIGHLDVHEAYVRMGSREIEWVVIPAVMGVGLLIVALLFAPMLIHGLDGGHAEVTVAELVAGKPLDTRHLTILGRADVHRMVRANSRPDATQESAAVWMPLVTADSAPDSPVRVVLETRLVGDNLEALAAARTHRGLLRDVWWEGLDGAQRKRLIAGGVRLAPEVKLFHHGVQPQDDLAISVFVIGFMFFILLVVTVVLRKRAHRFRV